MTDKDYEDFWEAFRKESTGDKLGWVTERIQTQPKLQSTPQAQTEIPNIDELKDELRDIEAAEKGDYNSEWLNRLENAWNSGNLDTYMAVEQEFFDQKAKVYEKLGLRDYETCYEDAKRNNTPQLMDILEAIPFAEAEYPYLKRLFDTYFVDQHSTTGLQNMDRARKSADDILNFSNPSGKAVAKLLGHSIGLWLLRLKRKVCWGTREKLGLHVKEEPFDTLCLRYKFSTLEVQNDYYRNNEFKKEYALRGFRLEYEAKKISAENLQEVCEAKRENEARLLKIEKEFAAELCGDSLCLFDLFGYVLRYGGSSNSLEFDEGATFKLDGKTETERWLSRQDTIKNYEGHTIAVRGIDEDTIEMLLRIKAEKAHEVSSLIIPNTDEEELCEMSLERLIKFRDIKNCKFKLSNENALHKKCYFEFSETAGFTKTDMEEKARAFANLKGYQFKVEEEHFAKKRIDIEEAMENFVDLHNSGREA